VQRSGSQRSALALYGQRSVAARAARAGARALHVQPPRLGRLGRAAASVGVRRNRELPSAGCCTCVAPTASSSRKNMMLLHAVLRFCCYEMKRRGAGPRLSA
jgi:hypothetical protein